MDESHEILLNSLTSSGIPIPPEVSSIQDLTPATLLSICARSLRMISNTSMFPTTLPESMAERYEICTDLASSFKDLGYTGDISFHKFLYPSEEDMYKLVRFLVGKLSESSATGRSTNKRDQFSGAILKEFTDDFDGGVHSLTRLEDLRLGTAAVDSSVIEQKNGFVGESVSIPQKMNEVTAFENGPGMEITTKDEKFQDSRNSASGNGETVAVGDSKHASELNQTLASDQENSTKMSNAIEKLQSREKQLLMEVNEISSELQYLEEKQELFEAAVEMAFDEQKPVASCITQLNEQIDVRRHNLMELESKWDAIIKPLEEKKGSLEEAICAANPGAREKIQKLKVIDLETQSIVSETKKRDEQLSKLSTELEKQQKLASRRSYIERVQEITKNSRKQDIDIERILKETRELQLESNLIQERLHRTYAVVNETVLREAKKDQVGQQAYRLLNSIHESFEQISEKILATDRAHREVADYEAKIAAISSRSFDVDKLQADLDAIRKENEILESLSPNTT